MIFGATDMARQELDYLSWTGSPLYSFIVSNKNGQPDELCGISVLEFGEISDDEKQNGLVLIARNKSNDDESYRVLNDAGFANIKPGLCQLSVDPDEKDVMDYIRMFNGFFSEKELIYNVEKCREIDCEKDILIYAVTSHNNRHKLVGDGWNSKYIEFIQAGAAMTDVRICNMTDCVGKNISEYNYYYSELTAGYWIAQNDNIHDWIGLYHYSRGLSLTDNMIKNLISSQFDVVLPSPYLWQYDIASFGVSDDVIEAIQRTEPDYVHTADTYFSSPFIIAGNILIAKRQVFRDFYLWQMTVIKELEILRKKNNLWTKGIIGYLSEYLLNIYFMYNSDKYKILFSKMKQLKVE